MLAHPAHPGEAIPDTVAKYLSGIGWCNWYIPEYQDVQRFIDDHDNYGPIAWSFAPPYLESFLNSTPFTLASIAVAIVYVQALPGTLLSRQYGQLGLEPGFNCVYLNLNGGNWKTDVTRSPAGGCANIEPAGAAGFPLSVLREAGAAANQYPPVTRYVERNDTLVAIGARCGDGWCTMGTNDAAKIQRPGYAGMTGAGTTSRWTIKGWFDDQHLAVPATGSTPAIRGQYLASIIPDENLANYRVSPHYKNGWVHVATVMMPGQVPQKYQSGWGFSSGKNEIYIHAAGSHWVAWIKDAAGNPHFRPVTRTAHNYQGIPATARWAWSDEDEPIWVYCGGACCYIERDS